MREVATPTSEKQSENQNHRLQNLIINQIDSGRVPRPWLFRFSHKRKVFASRFSVKTTAEETNSYIKSKIAVLP